MKYIALGVENFESIIEENYYVDHSFLIEEIEKTASGSAILFLRPRRFGKSLAISMLASFYGSSSAKKKTLFSHLIVGNNKKLMNLSDMPVINLKLKDAKAETYEDFVKVIAAILRREYSKFNYLFDSPKIDKVIKEEISKFLSGEIDEIFLKNSLFTLTEILDDITGQKPVILIDEYDTPIDYSKTKGYYEKSISLIRGIFSKALKGNEHIYKAILTGVVKIAKESLFSDMNNLIVDDGLNHKFTEPFAFSRDEVIDVMKYFSINANIDEVEKIYGGYKFSNKNYFNPWSILSFVFNNGTYRPYWTSTASNGQIFDSFNNDIFYIEKLNKLLEYRKISDINISNEFNYEYENNDYDSFFLFLRSAGYLTVDEIQSFSTVSLKMPNREIEEIFPREIMNRFLKNDLSSFLAIRRAFIEGNESALETLIKNNILSAFSYFDFGSEKAYQIMVLTLSALLFDQSIVKSEVNAGEGRCDLMISPKKPGQFGAVIEIKSLKVRTSKDRLESSSLKALNQIKNHLYFDELFERDACPIYAFGMSFQGKNISIRKEKVR